MKGKRIKKKRRTEGDIETVEIGFGEKKSKTIADMAKRYETLIE